MNLAATVHYNDYSVGYKRLKLYPTSVQIVVLLPLESGTLIMNYHNGGSGLSLSCGQMHRQLLASSAVF